jgi:hypothetical protein
LVVRITSICPFPGRSLDHALARTIHELITGLCSAYRKTDEYAANVAESLHYQLDTLEIEFPLFIYKNSGFVNNPG